jgi:hypothetical protein
VLHRPRQGIRRRRAPKRRLWSSLSNVQREGGGGFYNSKVGVMGPRAEMETLPFYEEAQTSGCVCQHYYRASTIQHGAARHFQLMYFSRGPAPVALIFTWVKSASTSRDAVLGRAVNWHLLFDDAQLGLRLTFGLSGACSRQLPRAAGRLYCSHDPGSWGRPWRISANGAVAS